MILFEGLAEAAPATFEASRSFALPIAELPYTLPQPERQSVHLTLLNNYLNRIDVRADRTIVKFECYAAAQTVESWLSFDNIIVSALPAAAFTPVTRDIVRRLFVLLCSLLVAQLTLRNEWVAYRGAPGLFYPPSVHVNSDNLVQLRGLIELKTWTNSFIAQLSPEYVPATTRHFRAMCSGPLNLHASCYLTVDVDGFVWFNGTAGWLTGYSISGGSWLSLDDIRWFAQPPAVALRFVCFSSLSVGFLKHKM